MQKTIKLFTNSAGALLLAVATVMFLINWTSPADYVSPQDPIFLMHLNELFWIIGGIAAVVALACFFSERLTLPIVLLAWLAVNVLVLRIGFLTYGCHSLSGYLEGFSYAFGISAGVANALADMIFAYLFVGSCVAFWLARRLPQSVEFQKMACPSCGGRVKFPLESLGQKIDCPHCKATIALRKPAELLKTSCYFCKEHIEFPAHALGQKASCPHCGMKTPLKEEHV